MGASFRIGDEEYQVPDTFRILDPVLVHELTGLDFQEFAELAQDSGNRDPRVLVAMVGVAVWQKHTTWKRDRVIRYLQDVNMEDVGFDQAEEDDAGPPDEPPAERRRSADTSDASTTSPAGSPE